MRPHAGRLRRIVLLAYPASFGAPTAGCSPTRSSSAVSNPKVFVFFVAVLSQFVDRSAGSVALQLLTLAAIFCAIVSAAARTERQASGP